MAEQTEIELKLLFDPDDAARLSAWAAREGTEPSRQHQVSTYFDTPDEDLRRAGYSLRIRRIGRRRVQTVKAGGDTQFGLFARGEWERPVRSGRPALDERAGPLCDVLSRTDLDRLTPAFITDIVRETSCLRDGQAEISCSIDHGTIRAGDREQPVAELELELEQGEPAALFTLARRIDAQVPLRLGVLAKAERGYLLAAAALPAHKAETPALRPSMTPTAAFRIIALECLRQFRLNEDLSPAGAADAVHQARVGVRRLRSAFSLFKPLLTDDPRIKSLREELRWLAGELGKVRDLDVLVPQVPAGDRDALLCCRADRFAGLEQQLRSDRARGLMLDLAEWLALGLELADGGGTDWPNALLKRQLKRLRKRGRGFSRLDDKQRHEVRKEAKKLRYGAEFFTDLFPTSAARRRQRTFVKRLSRLQDRLGEWRDLTAAPLLLAGLGLPDTLCVAGKRDKLDAKAEKAWNNLLDAKPFW